MMLGLFDMGHHDRFSKVQFVIGVRRKGLHRYSDGLETQKDGAYSGCSFAGDGLAYR